MATQGPNFPGTTANLSNAGTSENAEAWVNPGNVVSDNATEAQITAATYDSPDISQILVASNFNFNAVSGTVNGITVEIDRRSIIANSGKDFRVQLAKGTAFANLVGNNKAVPATIWPTTSAVATYGANNDLWGATWTAAEIAASSFAVFLSCQANIANADVGVDFIRVTVTYTPDNPTGTGSLTAPSATMSGAGAEVFTATGAITGAAATVAGSGAEVFTATGAISGQPPTVAGAGAEVLTATGAVSVPATTVAGSGDHTESGPTNPDGTGAISVPAATAAGSGELAFTATGSITASAPTVSGAGAEVLTATGSVTLPSATVSGSGDHTAAGVVDSPYFDCNYFDPTYFDTDNCGPVPSDGGHPGRKPKRKRPFPIINPPVQRVDEDWITLIL